MNATAIMNAAGINSIDIVLTIRAKGRYSAAGNATQLINKIYDAVTKNNMKFNTVWIKIDNCPFCWSTVNSNRFYFENLVTAVLAKGWKVGINTSKSSWRALFGLDYKTFAPITAQWYRFYNMQPNMNQAGTWASFGGWTQPTMKEYSPFSMNCFRGVTLNYRK